MKPLHIVLALLTAVLWGLAFVVSKASLTDFTPTQLTGLRFAFAGLPALVIAPPKISPVRLVLISFFLFGLQFELQFIGIKLGMPAGLTAFMIQSQALFTVLLATLWLGERPSQRQTIALGIGLCGLVLIALGLGQGATSIGFALVLTASLSFALGNLLLKTSGTPDMLPVIVWASALLPLPALLASWFLDHGSLGLSALLHAPLSAYLGPAFLGLIATTFGFSVWAYLLKTYSAAAIAPYALLAPCVGLLGSMVAFGERFGVLEFSGITAIFAGLVLSLVPARQSRTAD